MNEPMSEVTSRLASSKEAVIKRAISHALKKEDWSIHEITNRCNMRILKDNTEIFSFDGVDLLHFYVMKSVMDDSVIGFKITCSQQYIVLYNEE